MTHQEEIDLLTKEAKRILEEKHPEATEEQIEQWASGREKTGRKKTNVGNCIIEGCDKLQKIRHMCDYHYGQKYDRENNPYAKYYEALFGRRNFFMKCTDGVYRQIMR